MRIIIILLCSICLLLSTGCMSTDALQAQQTNYAKVTAKLDNLIEEVKDKVNKGDISVKEASGIWQDISDIKADVAAKQKETGDPWWLVGLSILGSIVGVRFRHQFPGLLGPPNYTPDNK